MEYLAKRDMHVISVVIDNHEVSHGKYCMKRTYTYSDKVACCSKLTCKVSRRELVITILNTQTRNIFLYNNGNALLMFPTVTSNKVGWEGVQKHCCAKY